MHANFVFFFYSGFLQYVQNNNNTNRQSWLKKTELFDYFKHKSLELSKLVFRKDMQYHSDCYQLQFSETFGD